MRGKLFIVTICALILLALCGFLVWVFAIRGGDSYSSLCSEALQGKDGYVKHISASGEFITHNEGLIFIGEKLEFELRVFYNPAQVDVIDRSLVNLNVLPYKSLDQGKVRTVRYRDCAEKRITFLLHALDVDAGRKNKLVYKNREGVEQNPEIEYILDGVLATESVSHEPPLVASLKMGKAHRLPSPAEAYTIEKQDGSEERKEWLFVTLLVIGAVLFLIGAFEFALILKRRIRGVEEESNPFDLSPHFPELYEEVGTPHERLSALYFSIERLLGSLRDHSLRGALGEILRNKIRPVFSGEYTREQNMAIIDELRSLLEANADVIGEEIR